MGRKKIYKDDKLTTKAIRLSEKYEVEYVLKFIQILRHYRQKAIKFIERFNDDN